MKINFVLTINLKRFFYYNTKHLYILASRHISHYRVLKSPRLYVPIRCSILILFKHNKKSASRCIPLIVG